MYGPWGRGGRERGFSQMLNKMRSQHKYIFLPRVEQGNQRDSCDYSLKQDGLNYISGLLCISETSSNKESEENQRKVFSLCKSLSSSDIFIQNGRNSNEVHPHSYTDLRGHAMRAWLTANAHSSKNEKGKHM